MTDVSRVKELRDRLTAVGVDALLCDEFRPDDIRRWTEVPRHQRDLRQELSRIESGEVEYLTVRDPDGDPTCKCGIDYSQRPDAGVIYQFDSAEGLWGLGLGGRLLSPDHSRGDVS